MISCLWFFEKKCLNCTKLPIIQWKKNANELALCHPPCASLYSVLAGQWSSQIFTHDKYNILSGILTEFEINPGIITEKYAKT